MNDPAYGPRDARRPTQIRWAGWRAILWRTIKAMAAMDTSLRCAGVAFFGFLSIFPAVAIGVSLVGLLADRPFVDELIARVSVFVPGIALDVVVERLDSLMSQPPAGLGIGLLISTVVALWSGSRGMNALIHAATVAHHESRERGFVAAVALSIAVTIFGAAFLIVALTLVAALPAIFTYVPVPFGAETIALWLRWPVLFLLAMLGFMLLYRYTLTRRAAKLRWIWPGALVGSLFWLISCLLFSLYVENIGGFEASFGSLASAVVLLLWLYNSALIFVLGASFNAEIELQTRRDSTIGPEKPMGQRGAYVADHVVGGPQTKS